METRSEIIASTASLTVLVLALLYLAYHAVLFMEQLLRTMR